MRILDNSATLDRHHPLAACTGLLALALFLTWAPPSSANNSSDPFDAWQVSDRGRIELGIGAGAVTNDPFLNRLIITPRIALHIHELFAVDLRFIISPDRGEDELKDLAHRLMEQKEVVPDLSRLIFAFTPGVLFSPLHLETGNGAAFDLSFFLGGGLVVTHDDEDLAFWAGSDTYLEQVHPAFAAGVSVRMLFEPGIAISFHPQLTAHVEQYEREGAVYEETREATMMMVQVSFLPPRAD